jgi:hypothetical protein
MREFTADELIEMAKRHQRAANELTAQADALNRVAIEELRRRVRDDLADAAEEIAARRE